MGENATLKTRSLSTVDIPARVSPRQRPTAGRCRRGRRRLVAHRARIVPQSMLCRRSHWADLRSGLIKIPDSGGSIGADAVELFAVGRKIDRVDRPLVALERPLRRYWE